MLVSAQARRPSPVRPIPYEPTEATRRYLPLLQNARKGARGLFMVGNAGGDGWTGAYGWYAVRTAPQSEKAMVEKLRGQGIEAFTPIEVKQRRIRNGRGKTRGKAATEAVERAFFPGYIFVRVAMCGRLWTALRAEDGIVEIVSVSLDGLPTLVPDREMDFLLGHGPFRIEKQNPYKPGEVVRIVDGPWRGFEAAIARVDTHDRIKLFFTLFGRSVEAEFENEQVERVAGRHSPRAGSA